MLGSDSPIPPQLSPFTRRVLAGPGLGVTLRVVLSAEMELGTRWVMNGFVTPAGGRVDACAGYAKTLCPRKGRRRG